MSKRKGQVVIVATLVIAILVLSVAAMIYQALTSYESMRREYFNGLINNINSEFDKVLTYILMSATQTYDKTAEIYTPRADAYMKFTYWKKSILRELAVYGAEVNVTMPKILLQRNRTLYDMHIEDRYAENLLKMYWYVPQALSVISARITINIPGEGFYGWNKTTLILLNATVLVDQITDVRYGSKSYTTVPILVNREYGIPIERLTNASFRVLYFEPDYNDWREARIPMIENNGGGNYTLYLSRNITGGGSLPTGLEKNLIIWVRDYRGIIVELYTYDHIDYIVTEHAITQFHPDIEKPYEIYTFEVIQNGSWYWLNRELPCENYRPIPIPPVKQLRVYSTRHGVNDTKLVEVPSQVEVWTTDYKRPTLAFADWRRRFSLGDKLVFIVNFTDPGVDKQKIRIRWLHDADTPPPSYRININVQPPFAYISNGVYTLQLVANPGYSDWIDWSISLHGNGYHIEYSLYGYDVYRFSGGYWFPMKLPGGNWNILAGPIRAIAYRESDIVVIPPLETQTTSELYHVELIEVPYGVNYFLYFGYFRWINTVTLRYRYLTLFGQISGTRDDIHSRLRMKYGSIQVRDGGYITGNYTIYDERNPAHSNSMHRFRAYNDAGNFGYWAAQYNDYYGQAMFTNEETYDLLTARPYRDYSQVWAWSTYDYARRVMSYDLLYWGNRRYRIRSGTEMNIFFAGMLYDGGRAYYPYKNPYIWRYYDVWNNPIPYIFAYQYSDGAVIPQIYYRMFLESYRPSIEVLG